MITDKSQFIKKNITFADRYLAKYSSQKYFGKTTDSAYIGMLSEIICKDIMIENKLQILSYERGETNDFLGLDILINSGTLKNYTVDIKGAYIKGENYNKIFLLKRGHVKQNNMYALSFMLKEGKDNYNLYFVGFIDKEIVDTLPFHELYKSWYFPLEENEFNKYKDKIIKLENIL